MSLAMAASGISPRDVGYLSANATGTRKGDLSETNAIKLSLGRHAYRIPVSATKSMHGHAFGSSGTIETVLALGAMTDDRILPTANLTVPDPACDLDFVPLKGRRGKADILLKNSFGVGGASSCIIIRRGDRRLHATH